MMFSSGAISPTLYFREKPERKKSGSTVGKFCIFSPLGKGGSGLGSLVGAADASSSTFLLAKVTKNLAAISLLCRF